MKKLLLAGILGLLMILCLIPTTVLAELEGYDLWEQGTQYQQGAAVTLAADNPFIDVNSTDYFYDAVLWAVEHGVTTGTSATRFSPDLACTRAQMVTLLWRAAGSPTATGTTPFTDVDPTAYYYNALRWAWKNSVTLGTSDTTFSPDMTVTRAQVVTLLYRYHDYPGVSSGNPFRDVASMAYYNDAVRWAVMNGITLGTSSTTFSPDNDCTRAQIVTFLFRDLSEQNVNDIDIVNNESEFVQSDAFGTALFFNKWHFKKSSSGSIGNCPYEEGFFTIDGKIYYTGLGSDGLTIEGFDKRGFSYIEYVVQSGGFTEISGVFGFDDTTEIRPDSKLIIYADGDIIYESEYINEEQNSIEIHAPISSDTQRIAFRFETNIEQDLIPKIVFAQIMAHRVDD